MLLMLEILPTFMDIASEAAFVMILVTCVNQPKPPSTPSEQNLDASPKQICGPAFACYQQINQPAWIFSEDGSPQTDQYLSLSREGTEKMICSESGRFV